MKSMKKISIVIPVYNEEEFIEKTIQEVINSDTLGLKKEIISVDDGSRDKTSSILKKLENKFKNAKDFELEVIIQKINRGKGSALKKGFLASTGDVVLVQDADLEYNPTDYPILLAPFSEKEADVVYGSRFILIKEAHQVVHFWHYQVNNFLTIISNIFSNLRLTDMETGYKVFRGDLIRKIAENLKSERFGFEPEITAKLAKIKDLKFYEVGISYTERSYDKGKKISWKDGVKAIWEIVKYNLLVK